MSEAKSFLQHLYASFFSHRLIRKQDNLNALPILLYSRPTMGERCFEANFFSCLTLIRETDIDHRRVLQTLLIIQGTQL